MREEEGSQRRSEGARREDGRSEGRGTEVYRGNGEAGRGGRRMENRGGGQRRRATVELRRGSNGREGEGRAVL